MSSVDSQPEVSSTPIASSPSSPKRSRNDSPPPIAPGSAVIIERTDEVLFGRVVSLDNGIYTIDVSGDLAVASERNVRPARFTTHGNQIFFRCQIDCGGNVADLICTGVSTKKMTVISRHPVFAGAVICADDCDRCEIMHVVSVEEREAVAECEEKLAHALKRIESIAGVDVAEREESEANRLAAASLVQRPRWQTEPVDKRIDRQGKQDLASESLPAAGRSRVSAANAARLARQARIRSSVGVLPGMEDFSTSKCGDSGGGGEIGCLGDGEIGSCGTSVSGGSVQNSVTPGNVVRAKSPLERQVEVLRDCTEKILRAKWGDYSWVEQKI